MSDQAKLKQLQLRIDKLESLLEQAIAQRSATDSSTEEIAAYGQPADRPLSLDELAARPDLPATADVPQEVAAALAQPRVHIAGTKGQAIRAELLRAVEGVEDEFEMRLPAGAFLGRPGRSGERLAACRT